MPPSQSLIRRWLRDRRGTIVIVYALCLPVVALVIGFAIDFGRAAQLRTRLNAAADSAVLAALTPTMMSQSNTVAQAAVIAMFNGLLSSANGIAAGDTSLTVTVSNPSGNALIRQVTLCYNADESTIFAGVLGVPVLPMGNCAKAQAQIPPNIDFYLLLDNSPSMQLPATQAGITKMQSLTPLQGPSGCAFACHEASVTSWDTWGNPCSNGTAPTLNGGESCAASQGAQIDNYALARKYSIVLRLDVLTSAVTTLMDTAQTTSNSTPYNPPPAYRFAANAMDSPWQIGFTSLMSLTSNFISGWSSASSKFGVMEMYDNSNVCASAACTSGAGLGDVETNYDDAMSHINSQMPNPGNGTNQAGDSPQEVLFFVTDGVEDEISGGSRLIQPINYGTSTNYCTAIKARGIKIAILYTEYLPVPDNYFYEDYVAPFQSSIGPALQACASPGLYYDAAIGADLGAALTSLFEAVVHSANLTQ